MVVTHFREVDMLIRRFRNNLNCLDLELQPLLKTVSKEAKEFMMSFCEQWDEAIIGDNSFLFDYSKTAIVLNNMQAQYLNQYGYDRTVLCQDIKYFLNIQAREKDNDLQKSNAENAVLEDIDVMHYCYVHWRDLED